MSQTKAQLISDLVQALNFTGTSSAPANGVYLNSANKIGLSTASTNRLVIDPNGCVLIGGGISSVTVGSVSAGLQLHSTVSTNGAQFSIARFNNDTAGGRLVLGKSRHSTTAGGTIVQAGDFAGIIEFAVDDGQDLVSRIAEIRAVVETGVAADDTPGYLSFRTTADNAASTTERLRINKDGNALFYNFTDNIGSSSSGEGFEFRRGEALRLQRDNGTALIVNRVSASGDIITLRDNATSIGSLGYDDTYTYLDTAASKPLALKVAGGTKLVINSSGEVLIGSTVDRGSQKLQVTGQITNGPSDNWSTTASYYDIASYGGLTTQGSYEITLTAGGYRNGSGWVDYTINSASGYGAQIALNPVSGKIGFRTESGMSTGDTHTINERMMIASNGQVGVNITPDASGGLFQIRNNMVYTSGTTDLLTSASKAALRIRTSSDSSKSLYFGGIDEAATPYLQAGNMSAASSGATASYAIVLNPYGGEVGIGTTTPAEKLHVHGAIRSSANSADWGAGSEGFFADYYAAGSMVRLGHVNGASGSAKNIRFYSGGVSQFELNTDGATVTRRGVNFPNPNNTGAEITASILKLGSDNLQLQERYPDGAYADRCDLVIRTNSGYGAGQSDKVRFRAGGGICFGTDTASANALDDYEEGTWTPVPSFDSGTTGMTYQYAPSGIYTKIGRQVTVRFGFSWTNKGTSTGAFKITGLPFNATHSAYNHFVGPNIVFNGPNANGNMMAYVSTSTLNFRMYNEANTNVSPNDTDFDNDSKLMGTMTYMV